MELFFFGALTGVIAGVMVLTAIVLPVIDQLSAQLDGYRAGYEYALVRVEALQRKGVQS